MNAVRSGSGAELIDLVSRIMSGDPLAEDDLVSRYRQGIFIIVDRIVKSRPAAEDVSQETFRIILEKVRRGDVRYPERLSGFVCGIARNAAIDYVRRARKVASLEDLMSAEKIPDPGPSQLEVILSNEKASIVRRIITELKRERDKEVLFRYFIAEEDKDTICRALDLTRLQLNSVIFRAIARFKKLYMEQEKNSTEEVQ